MERTDPEWEVFDRASEWRIETFTYCSPHTNCVVAEWDGKVSRRRLIEVFQHYRFSLAQLSLLFPPHDGDMARSYEDLGPCPNSSLNWSVLATLSGKTLRIVRSGDGGETWHRVTHCYPRTTTARPF